MAGDMHDMLELRDTVVSTWRLTACFLAKPAPDPDDAYHS
jgi:hypothetical protein